MASGKPNATTFFGIWSGGEDTCSDTEQAERKDKLQYVEIK